MGEAGLEPARPYGQGILNPQRLPFRHTPDRTDPFLQWKTPALPDYT